MESTKTDDYAAGMAAGQVQARLAAHDQQFTTIAVSLGRIENNLSTLALQTQRLGDQAIARDKQAVDVANALKDAETERTLAAERAWSPLSRLSLAAGVLFGCATVVETLFLIIKH